MSTYHKSALSRYLTNLIFLCMMNKSNQETKLLVITLMIAAVAGLAAVGSLNIPVNADRECTVGDVIDGSFPKGRERGEHASSVAPLSQGEPNIHTFTEGTKSGVLCQFFP